MSAKKIFIDCGFHHGEGLRHFIKKLGIDTLWFTYAFEPNPACDIKNRFYKIFPNGIPFEHAVWTESGTINFRQENHFKSESGSPADGTSMVDGWASQIADLQGTFPCLENAIEVKSVDFSIFIEDRYLSWRPCEIYCKMDIEGAEFPVLRKMLADGTVKYIKKLWIEFHEQYIPGESDQSKKDLIKQLSQFTEVEKWH